MGSIWVQKFQVSGTSFVNGFNSEQSGLCCKVRRTSRSRAFGFRSREVKRIAAAGAAYDDAADHNMITRGSSEFQLKSRILMVNGAMHHNKTPPYYSRAAKGLVEMSRPANFLPSFALCFVGSWMSAGRSLRVVLMPAAWTTSLCCALIGSASMLVNDFYDYKLGTDELNQRKSLLQSGEVDPDDVMLAAWCIYGAVMIAACCLEPPKLRLLITTAALVTFVYTPLLKKITLVKNVVVAVIIASSIAAGGMVTTTIANMPTRTVVSSLYVFFSLLGREIVMDVRDVAGDRATGVKTIAACFGTKVATLVAGIFTAAANAFLVQVLWMKSQGLAALMATIATLPLHFKLMALFRSQFGGRPFEILDPAEAEVIISRESLLSLAFGIVTLAISL